MFSQQRSCVCLPLPPWPGVQTDSSERVGISANLGPRVSCAAVPTPWWHPCRAASSTSPPPFTSPHSCTSLSAEMSRQGRPTSARHGDAVGRKAAPHMSSPRAQGAPSPLHLPPAKKNQTFKLLGPPNLTGMCGCLSHVSVPVWPPASLSQSLLRMGGCAPVCRHSGSSRRAWLHFSSYTLT